MNQASKTLVDRALHWEAATPNAIFLTQPHAQGVDHYSWAQALDQARRFASYLNELKLPPGSHITILSKNSAHWIIADLGIWLAGHVSVPLYPALHSETAIYVLTHSDARLLVIGKMDETAAWPPMRERLAATIPIVTLPLAPAMESTRWEAIMQACEPLRTVSQPAPEELASILYTSGSTGLPKGVMHSHGAMESGAAIMSRSYQVNTQSRYLSYLPLAHVAERVGVEAVSLCAGAHIYFADRLDTFAADLRRARPTHFFSVPRLWTKFYQAVNEKLPLQRQQRLFRIPLLSRLLRRAILKQLGLQHTRIAVSGAAPLPQKLIDWYRQLGLELLEAYGMTENLGYSHLGQVGQFRLGYIGHPQPGVLARIADDGELLVKSPGQMLGYYKMPEKLAEDLTPDGYFKTGDRGEIDASGRLRLTGRVKELFKTSKGKYIAPAPIENRLGDYPKIETVCVTGPSRPQPFALLILPPEIRASSRDADPRAQLSAELEALLGSVNENLADHEKLDFAVVLDDLWTPENGLLTPTLKIKRAAVEQRYLARADSWADSAARSGRRIVWDLHD